MPSIVRYRDDKPARAKWPTRIVSPTHASRCCWTDMAALGGLQTETHAHVHHESALTFTDTVTFQYMRCLTCGFTVRRIVAEEPDHHTFEALRADFAKPMFRRVDLRDADEVFAGRILR